jgi:hypothetical protein
VGLLLQNFWQQFFCDTRCKSTVLQMPFIHRRARADQPRSTRSDRWPSDKHEPAGSSRSVISPFWASPFGAKSVSCLQAIALLYWPEPAHSTSHSLHHIAISSRMQEAFYLLVRITWYFTKCELCTSKCNCVPLNDKVFFHHIRFSLHRSSFSHQAQRIALSHCHPLIWFIECLNRKFLY